MLSSIPSDHERMIGRVASPMEGVGRRKRARRVMNHCFGLARRISVKQAVILIASLCTTILVIARMVPFGLSAREVAARGPRESPVVGLARFHRNLDIRNDAQGGGGAKKHVKGSPANFQVVKNVEISLEYLQSSQFANQRGDLVKSIQAGSTFLNADDTHQHGVIGLNESGVRHWSPGPKPPHDMNMAAELRRGGGFNLALSDALPLDREIPDARDEACRRIDYDKDSLGDASVVIVFFNEPFSTLMRSVHSVLNLTPPRLLREIILVDDGSSWINAAESAIIDEYVALLPKTRLIRLPERVGIVGARMAGIRAAAAPTFVILDSHIEVQPGWLEPIVKRIGEDPTRIIMPVVDGTEQETLLWQPGGIGCTLGFLWKLIEHSFEPDADSLPSRQHAKATDFVTSPTMAGGLFAANVDFFFSIGAYDEHFRYWGTENLELSFRLWTCGGVLECAPCSRVYHIFRKGGVGYSSPEDSTTKNKMRTLTIWMDQYADLAWRVMGQPRVDFGPYEENRKWREQKQCKSFKWFLETVNPESEVVDLPADVPFLGWLKNVGSRTCLDMGGSDHPGEAKAVAYQCHGGRTQDWMFFNRVQHVMPVSNDETCLTGDEEAGRTNWCYKHQQMWRLRRLDETADGDDVGMSAGRREMRKRERKRVSRMVLEYAVNNRCLAVKESALAMVPCDTNDRDQQWDWQNYDPPAVFTPPPPLVSPSNLRKGDTNNDE